LKTLPIFYYFFSTNTGAIHLELATQQPSLCALSFVDLFRKITFFIILFKYGHRSLLFVNIQHFQHITWINQLFQKGEFEP